MKRNSLSKSVRAFSLMAILSAVVATSVQQPIQAQNLPAENKSDVCAPSPPYEEFKGIKFSSAQKAAYRKIEAKINKRYNAISASQAASYTPEQIAQGKRIGRDFEAQTMAILRPDQQKIYKVNLALQQRIQKSALACGFNDLPFDRIISPSPY